MSLVSRLERRFGRFAIGNLTTILIAGQAALYVASWMPQGVSIERIVLDPERVAAGEWWRVITFLFAPPGERPLFVVFYFMLFHLFGSTLERQWGVFRFNLFILIGWLANVSAAFLASALVGAAAAAEQRLPLEGMELAPTVASNVFLYSSLFLAFARLYPDYILNLFFVLPIRIKWLALVQWLFYGYLMIRGDVTQQLLVLATVLNYMLFFGAEHWRELRHANRRRTFRAATKKSLAPPRHVCRVCGLSNEASPRTLFRYCSKCVGQACYCPEHIREHEHVTAEQPAAGA